MVKRGKISFAGGLNIFRMSIPNVDVDLATPGQLLLDEAILYPQVVESFFIPYSSSPGGVVRSLIDIGQVPFVYSYPVLATGENTFPCQRYWASAYSTAMSTRVWYTVAATSIQVYFSTTDATLAGVKFITMRRATG